MKRYAFRYTFPMDPVSKPRQTRRDVWAERPAVMRYRSFADELRLRAAASHFTMPHGGAKVSFNIAMPRSWSKKKRAAHAGRPHQTKPDLDNLAKAFLDALIPDDSVVHEVTLCKIWAERGSIVVEFG